MARGRMINKSVAIDRRLNSLSLAAHWLYLMTIPHLDRDGLIAGDAPLLAAVAMPRRPELHSQTDVLIEEWVTAGLVVRYATADTDALFFVGFAKNQRLEYHKEAASDFPPPPGWKRTPTGLVEDAAPQSPAPRAPHAAPRDEPRAPGVDLPDAPVAPDSSATLAQGESEAREGSDQLAVKIKINRSEVKLSEEAPPPIPAIPAASSGRNRAARLQELNATVPAATRVPLANALLDLTGLRALAEVASDAGERVLAEAHEGAVALWRMDYQSPAAIEALAAAWNDDWRGARGTRPSLKQALELASSLRGPALVKRGNGHGKPTTPRQPAADLPDNSEALRRSLERLPDHLRAELEAEFAAEDAALGGDV